MGHVRSQKHQQALPCTCLLSHIWLFATPWAVACQAPLFMEFLRQKYWEWIAISYFRGPSWPRDQTHVSCIGRRILYQGTTWEAQLYHTAGLYDDQLCSGSPGRHRAIWKACPRLSRSCYFESFGPLHSFGSHECQDGWCWGLCLIWIQN